MLLHEVSQVFSTIKALLHITTQTLSTVVDPAKSEFEAVAFAAALERCIGEIPADFFRFIVIWSSVEKVAGLEAVCAPKDTHVTGQEEGAGDGYAEHLVRVGSDAAGSLDTCKLVTVLFREDGAAAPGGIDVHPEVVFFAEVRDFGERVKGAENSGTKGSVDEEGLEALKAGFS